MHLHRPTEQHGELALIAWRPQQNATFATQPAMDGLFPKTEPNR
jgi:hypothetical protein